MAGGSSFAKVLEIARYSCGFAQSDRLNLWQIWEDLNHFHAFAANSSVFKQALRNGDEITCLHL